MHGLSLRALIREAMRTMARAPRGTLPREIEVGWADRTNEAGSRRLAARKG